MGKVDGCCVGARVGFLVGVPVPCVGTVVGLIGCSVGDNIGLADGVRVVGDTDGVKEGCAVGVALVGALDTVGDALG